jgi:hypothetical protein
MPVCRVSGLIAQQGPNSVVACRHHAAGIVRIVQGAEAGAGEADAPSTPGCTRINRLEKTCPTVRKPDTASPVPRRCRGCWGRQSLIANDGAASVFAVHVVPASRVSRCLLAPRRSASAADP